MNLEIIHDRDPDRACGLRVFVNGQEVDAEAVHVADVDPGRGFARDEWDAATETLEADEGRSGAFREAAVAVRNDAADHSEHVH